MCHKMSNDLHECEDRNKQIMQKCHKVGENNFGLLNPALNFLRKLFILFNIEIKRNVKYCYTYVSMHSCMYGWVDL